MPDTTLLFLHALSGLHPGSGAALDVIDLPVQRERHTNWPLIPGSSLKGVLRATTAPAQGDQGTWQAVFGPPTAEADKHAGAVSISDARLLAFPVRSLKGVFAWVTCPAVLERLKRDIGFSGLAHLADRLPTELPEVAPENILCGEEALLVDAKSVLLEEFDFDRTGDSAPWARALAGLVTADTDLGKSLTRRLAILSNDDFTHFVTHATEVSARIGLDPASKTVKDGALFYQEVLPPECLFYALAMGYSRKAAGVEITGADALAWLKGRTPQVIQVGADETIGRGFCATHFVDPQTAGEALG